MADMEINNSTKNNSELQRVKITVESEEERTGLHKLLNGKRDVQDPDNLAIIQEALSFDLVNATSEEILANNIQLRYLLYCNTELLEEKSVLCRNLERQISTLELQSNSLKNLLSITKDLLAVRNMEVTSLHDDLKNMEGKINKEKVKHREILSNMSESVKIISKNIKYEGRLFPSDSAKEEQTENSNKKKLVETGNKQPCDKMYIDSIAYQTKVEEIGKGDTEITIHEVDVTIS